MTDHPDSTEHPERPPALTGEIVDDAEELPVLPAERDWPRPWMSLFLRSLSSMPDVSAACRIARIGRTAAYDARKNVEGFSGAWDEALQLAQDLVQQHAHRWITTGVPVKSSRTVTKTKRDKDGNVVETVTETFETETAERSATLMIFWLKAWHPERYRWREGLELGGIDGGPIQIESIDQIDRRIMELQKEIDARAAPALAAVAGGEEGDADAAV